MFPRSFAPAQDDREGKNSRSFAPAIRYAHQNYLLIFTQRYGQDDTEGAQDDRTNKGDSWKGYKKSLPGSRFATVKQGHIPPSGRSSLPEGGS